MPPRKKPCSLFKLSIKSCLLLIKNACVNIEKENPEKVCPENQDSVQNVKEYLLNLLPARLFDILCEQRSTVCGKVTDPRIILTILTHPHMNVFRKCDLDTSIPQYFWLQHVQKLTKLRLLDLRLVCTDEILIVVGKYCPLIEEINIISKVDIRRSPFNASVLIRNVSDNGLLALSILKLIRIISLDSPRNVRANCVGRCITQSGIRQLVQHLPKLEELRVESCDIGAALISSDIQSGPLNLRKISCHFGSVEGVKRLVVLCPYLREFSITHLSEQGKDEILQTLGTSDLELTKLELSFFIFNYTMIELLRLKGMYLTQFSLWEIENTMNFEAILSIGKHCPYLECLKISSQSKNLIIPKHYIVRNNIFKHLKTLTVGNINIEELLMFFLKCTDQLEQLMIKYQSRTDLDSTLVRLLETKSLKNLNYLWLDCTLYVSKLVIKRVIDECEKLQTLVFDCPDDISDLHNHIRDNNLDLRLDSNY